MTHLHTSGSTAATTRWGQCRDGWSTKPPPQPVVQQNPLCQVTGFAPGTWVDAGPGEHSLLNLELKLPNISRNQAAVEPWNAANRQVRNGTVAYALHHLV